MAFTTLRRKSITFCPFTFEAGGRRDILGPWRSGEKFIPEGVPLFFYASTSGNFLHELSHLVTDGRMPLHSISYNSPACSMPLIHIAGVNDQKYGDQPAYGPVLSAWLAALDPTRAVVNADSYTWFAIAMYLPQYDWSRAMSAKRAAGQDLYIKGNDGLKSRTFHIWNLTYPMAEDEGEDDMS